LEEGAKIRLRFQIEVLLLGLVALFVVSAYVVGRAVVYTSFENLERQQAGDDIQRIVEALDREQEHLRTVATDWGLWDETYRYALERHSEFSDTNLTDAAYPAAGVDLIAVLDAEGDLVWGNYWNSEAEVQVPLEPAAEPWYSSIATSVPESAPYSYAGVVLSSRGPLLLGLSQILTSAVEGPSRGTHVMGRLLDGEFRDALAAQTRVNFVLWTIDEIPPEEFPHFERTADGESLIVEEGDRLHVYQTYPGIGGEPLLLILARVPRNVTAEGRWALGISMATVTAISLFLLVVTGLLLDRAVVRPLQGLTAAMAAIRESGNLAERVPVQTGNEIGQLAAEFNDMLARLQRDSAERVQMTEELRRLSERDGLTGLLNRRRYDAVLAEEWQRHRREKLPLSVAVLDVDHFKTYNDTLGHQAGDAVLVEIANCIRSLTRRAGDKAARYGGEEFVVIMPATDGDGARKRAEAINRAVRELGIRQADGSVLTVSLGVATAVPSGDHPPEILFERADGALYRAKEQGRDRVERHGA